MPPGAGGPFDLVFLDPPYGKNLVALALAALVEGGWLAVNALVIAETAADEPVPAGETFRLADQRLYGDTSVTSLISISAEL
jgi:16S rRNA (guanine966-N2)-methyltransferase